MCFVAPNEMFNNTTLGCAMQEIGTRFCTAVCHPVLAVGLHCEPHCATGIVVVLLLRLQLAYILC